MWNKPAKTGARYEEGISLIELILFIMIIGIGLAGILSVINTTTRSSADPLLNKQALAIAEALMEEVTATPFRDCDVDPNTETCTPPDGIGPEPGEVRGSATNPFDHVNDYHGFNLAGGGTDIGAGVQVPAGYAASVTVAADNGFGPAGLLIPSADALLITITVTAAATGQAVVLQSYRTLDPASP